MLFIVGENVFILMFWHAVWKKNVPRQICFPRKKWLVYDLVSNKRFVNRCACNWGNTTRSCSSCSRSINLILHSVTTTLVIKSVWTRWLVIPQFTVSSLWKELVYGILFSHIIKRHRFSICWTRWWCALAFTCTTLSRLSKNKKTIDTRSKPSMWYSDRLLAKIEWSALVFSVETRGKIFWASIHIHPYMYMYIKIMPTSCVVYMPLWCTWNAGCEFKSSTNFNYIFLKIEFLRKFNTWYIPFPVDCHIIWLCIHVATLNNAFDLIDNYKV